MDSYINNTGKMQLISEMTDTHLVHAIKFFTSRVEAINVLNGEASVIDCDWMPITGIFQDTSNLEQLIKALKKELRKRKGSKK